MTLDPVFLTLDEILFIHKEEIQTAGGEPNIRDREGVEACTEAPKSSFGGEYFTTFSEWQLPTLLA
jgi:prophage maintenance system killer protein